MAVLEAPWSPPAEQSSADAAWTASFDEWRRIWSRKPALRAVYAEWSRWIAEAQSTVPGASLEIGSGIGQLKEFLPQVLLSDRTLAAGHDLALDSCRLPLRDGALANLIGIDMLHHVSRPLALLREAARVLAPGGRLILLEPYMTPVSRQLYRLHREPTDFRVDVFREDRPVAGSHPDEANQAVPTILFKRALARCQALVPQLRLHERRPCSYAAYPLSLGFQPRQLLPTAWLQQLLRWERGWGALGEWAACRIFVVWERQREGVA